MYMYPVFLTWICTHTVFQLHCILILNLNSVIYKQNKSPVDAYEVFFLDKYHIKDI